MADVEHAQQVAPLRSERKTPYSRAKAALRHSIVQNDEIDLTKLVGAMWRGKWVIAGVTSLAIALGGFYAFRVAVPIYEAKSVVLLDTKQERITNIENVVAGMTGDTSEVNSEIEILRSRELLGHVVDRLALIDDPEFNVSLREPSTLGEIKQKTLALLRLKSNVETPNQPIPNLRDSVITRLLQNTRVSNVRNSLVFQITVSSISPQKAAEIADTIADEYTQSQLRVKFDATEKANAWLSNRVAELQIELEGAEQEISNFRAETRLISAEVLQSIERQQKDLQDRISNLEEARSQQVTFLAALDNAQGMNAVLAVADDPVLNQIAARQTGGDQPSTRFQARVQALKDTARADIERTNRQVEKLQISEAELQAQIQQQNADLIRLQQLQREAQAIRLLYEHFLTRLKETSAQQGIQQADSRIISRAVVPESPTAPRKSLLLTLSGMLGLVLGAGVVLLREMRNRSFKTAADLEAFTGHPVLGEIPAVPMRKRQQILKYVNDKPTSAAAEAVRSLRTALLLSDDAKAPKVIVMSSALPGDGKTTSSVLLAHNFGLLGQRVLLIDGDLRRQSLRAYVKDPRNVGLISVLTGKSTLAEAVHHCEVPKAHCLLAEDSPVNPADMFASAKFASFIADARKQYDVIIIDTAPILIVPDARIIAKHGDALLLNVRWDQTTQAQVEEALRMVHNAGQEVSGIVLNAISARGMKRYGYAGEYGAYAAYGAKYYSN